MGSALREFLTYVERTPRSSRDLATGAEESSVSLLSGFRGEGEIRNIERMALRGL